jgi:AbiV family abortive infection protein
MEVSLSVLLEGVVFSLVNCGRLLSDAMVLYDAGSEQTAAGLAMLAREELGKYRILLKLWRESVKSGARPTVGQIQAACEDHTEKQRMATLGWTITAEPGSAIDTAMRTFMNRDAPSAEREKAAQVLESAKKASMKRAPEDRHNTRMRAFYVDLDNSGQSWIRPQKITREEAKKLLNEAANDYAVQSDRMDPDRVRALDEKLADALEELKDRPIPPAPVWPE